MLPDLGGARMVDALRVLFEERDAATLLVIDSLDEARSAERRIRQADSLPPPWRIILTTRPGSWDRQLDVSRHDPTQYVADLRPLRYPDDVEPFVTAWFDGRPDQAADLIAQLRGRPDLQQTATVPLILALYCIIGGGQPLPARRADVYAKVIRRMLSGRWRGFSGGDPDPDVCLEVLRDWARSAASSMPKSGVGDWQDAFPTARVRLSQDERDALDHVAVPLGRSDIDTGEMQRRFVHRSIHEHLVTEHVALRMPPEQAAGDLLNHLWYDPDWDSAAPAALATHPQRDQVLSRLISRITGSPDLPADLAHVDGCLEIRRFLAHVALESAEADWSPLAARVIGQARVSLIASKLDSVGALEEDPNLGMARAWPTSNRQILDLLLSKLEGRGNMHFAWMLGRAAARVDPRPEHWVNVRTALLERAAREATPWVSIEVTEAVTELEPTAEERAELRARILGHLYREADQLDQVFLVDALVQLAVTDVEREFTLASLLTRLDAETDPWMAVHLAERITGLETTAEQRARARAALMSQLAGLTY